MSVDVADETIEMDILPGEWHGILTVEGVETGDGRFFAANSLDWEDLPAPLQYARVNLGEHNGSVNVGSIEWIERRPTSSAGVFEIWGGGRLDLGCEEGKEAQRKMGEGFLRGNSVDVDDISAADVELVFSQDAPVGAQPDIVKYNKGRIRGTTLVDFPAFIEAKVQLGEKQIDYGLVASGGFPVPTLIWPGVDPNRGVGLVAAEPGAWDVHTHFSVLTASAGQMIAVEDARVFFAHVPPPFADGKVNSGECRYLHHTVTADGRPGLPNLTACASSINSLNGRPGRLTLIERKSAYAHLSDHLLAAGVNPPPFEMAVTAEDELVAAATITLDDAPPADWFAKPDLTGPTALQVTSEGRIFGHGALWDSCHTGFPGACVSPPEELSHDYFQLGEIFCAGGERVPVGQITLGTGHAATQGLSARGAIEHYDHTGTVVADIATGNDDHGIWVAGALRPAVTAAQARELMGAKLSGDWRRIAGSLRLVAFLAVNVPGFPVPRKQVGILAGEQLSLVAAGVVSDEAVVVSEPAVEPVADHVGVVDSEEITNARDALARRLGRDPESVRERLASRLVP